MIKSMGVPHPEIELIVANGVSVDFDYIVEPDAQIDIYSSAEPMSKCRPKSRCVRRCLSRQLSSSISIWGAWPLTCV